MRAAPWLAALALLTACGGSGSDDPAAGPAAASTGPQKQIQATPGAALADLTGWYWNPLESGTGFMFESQGSEGFVAFFLYDEVSGAPVWYAAQGSLLADASGGHRFSGDLRRYSGGQPLADPLRSHPVSHSVGQVSISFPHAGTAVVSLPARTIVAVRFVFHSGPGVPPAPALETGWYWNPTQGGRGYAVEVQRGRLFMALFHYDAAGEPIWELVETGIENGAANAPLLSFRGGQSLASGWRMATSGVGSGLLSLSVDNPCAARISITGRAPIPIQRFAFAGVPPGDECRALAATPPGAATAALLTWSPAPAPTVGYRVYHGIKPGRYDQPPGAGIFSPVPQFRWIGLAPGQVHRFAVTAVDGQGNESSLSNEATKSVP